jgi:hypothetical protein
MEQRWNETDRGKPKYSGKTCPSATLSTTNPTWTDPESNPGLRGERPATNRLSHGTALCANLQQDDTVSFQSQNLWLPMQYSASKRTNITPKVLQNSTLKSSFVDFLKTLLIMAHYIIRHWFVSQYLTSGI